MCLEEEAMNYQKAWLELKSRMEDLKNKPYEDSGTRLIRALGEHVLESMERIEEEINKDAELKVSDEVSSNMVRKNVYIAQRNRLGENYKIIASNKDNALRALQKYCQEKGIIFRADKVVFVDEFESELVEEQEESVSSLSSIEPQSLNDILNKDEQTLIDVKK